MIIDGKTIYSCSTLAIEAQGKNIRTVEGLAQGKMLHPVQQAFCDHDGLMCGFCTPGLRHGDGGAAREEPEADAGAGEEGARRQHLPLRHLRRVARSGARHDGGAPWLTRVTADATASAASDRRHAGARVQAPARPAQHPTYPWPEKPRLLGTRVKRLDGPDKVTGRAKYTYDITRPGMLYGAHPALAARARARSRRST